MINNFLIPGIPDAQIGDKPQHWYYLSACPPGRRAFSKEALLERYVLRLISRSPWTGRLPLHVHAALLAAILIIPLYFSQTIDLAHFQATISGKSRASRALRRHLRLRTSGRASAANGAQAERIGGQALCADSRSKGSIQRSRQRRCSSRRSAGRLRRRRGVVGRRSRWRAGRCSWRHSRVGARASPRHLRWLRQRFPRVRYTSVDRCSGRKRFLSPSLDYPRLAKDARVQGVVDIDAVIDVHGNVVQARAMDGPGLLIDAALKAVSQWKYEPTYLNGQPYPVDLVIQVTFSLG